jgi:hypothetical protein
MQTQIGVLVKISHRPGILRPPSSSGPRAAICTAAGWERQEKEAVAERGQPASTGWEVRPAVRPASVLSLSVSGSPCPGRAGLGQQRAGSVGGGGRAPQCRGPGAPERPGPARPRAGSGWPGQRERGGGGGRGARLPLAPDPRPSGTRARPGPAPGPVPPRRVSSGDRGCARARCRAARASGSASGLAHGWRPYAGARGTWAGPGRAKRVRAGY